jgi:hypothetical protein
MKNKGNFLKVGVTFTKAQNWINILHIAVFWVIKTLKNGVFCYCYFVFLRSVHRLLVTVNFVPSSPILVTLMMEALSSSKTLVLTRVTRRNIPEDAILHSHRRENLKSYCTLVNGCQCFRGTQCIHLQEGVLVTTYQTTAKFIHCRTMNFHSCENLKSYNE